MADCFLDREARHSGEEQPNLKYKMMSSKMTSSVQEQNLGITICFCANLTSVLNRVQKNELYLGI